MDIADNIKRIRKERGLSQVELAERAGVSRGAIQGYESGKFTPKPPAALLIAGALECNVIDLYGVQENEALNSALKELQRIEEQINENEKDISERGYPRAAGLAILIDHFNSLNYEGQDKVIDYASDLADNPKYQAAPPDQIEE